MEVKREIIKAANSIRNKYKALKRGRADEEAENKKYFDPLLKPLEKLVDLTGEYEEKDFFPIKSKKLKREKKELLENAVKEKQTDNDWNGGEEEQELDFGGEELEGEDEGATESVSNEFTDEVYSYEPEDEAAEQQARWNEYMQSFGPLTREYLTGMYHDSRDSYDHKFGVVFDPDTSTQDNINWTLGGKEIEFDRFDHVSVPGLTRKGTRGLMELLFKKVPKSEYYGRRDLDVYKEFLLATNAHKQGYRKDAPIASSGGKKYNLVIKKLFPPVGSGFLPLSENRIDLVYWNDVNELVERLLLLKASEKAGNTGLRAEILSIEQELREESIIE